MHFDLCWRGDVWAMSKTLYHVIIYHKCLYFWFENLQAKTWKLGLFYMEKSYPEKEGDPVNFRDRLYEQKAVPAKQPLTIALAHAMIVSPLTEEVRPRWLRLSLRTADAFPVVASLPPKIAVFRLERRDYRKCVCCSQANSGWAMETSRPGYEGDGYY